MAYYVFFGSAPERMLIVQSPEEALKLASEQAILGHAATFADDNGPLTLFALQVRVVSPTEELSPETPRNNPLH